MTAAFNLLSLAQLSAERILNCTAEGIVIALLAWLLLRHVAFGEMFLVCSIGTAIGGVLGWFSMTAGGTIMLNPLVGAFVGCVVAAFALRYRVQHA